MHLLSTFWFPCYGALRYLHSFPTRRSSEHWGPLQSGGSIDFTQPSPRIAVSAAVREVAAEVFWPQRPLGECLAALTALIHTEFTYDSQATTVTSTLEEVLAARHGVCQDFAHVRVAVARSVGLAARDVSD